MRALETTAPHELRQMRALEATIPRTMRPLPPPGAGPGCCSTNDGLLVVQDTRADSLTLAVVGLPSPTESKLHGVRKTARERRDNILLDDSRDQNTAFKKQFTNAQNSVAYPLTILNVESFLNQKIVSRP